MSVLDQIKLRVAAQGGVMDREGKVFSQNSLEKAYKGTKEYALASSMVEALEKNGILRVNQTITESHLCQMAHAISLYADSGIVKVNSQNSAKMPIVSEQFNRALSAVDPNGANAGLFSFSDPTVTAIMIAIVDNVVNADIKSYAGVKSMVGVRDSILRHNLVAKSVRGTVTAGTVVSGSLGEYVAGFTSNAITVKSTPLSTAGSSLTYTVPTALPDYARINEGTVFLRVVKPATVDGDDPIPIAYCSDSVRGDGGSIFTGGDLFTSATVNYSTGAITVNLSAQAPVGAYIEGIMMVFYGFSETNPYNLGVLTSDYDKLQINSTQYGVGVFTDQVQQASTVATAGIDGHVEAVKKALSLMNADYSACGIAVLKASASRTYQYKVIKDDPVTDPNGIAKFPYARWNFLYSLTLSINEMAQSIGKRPNVFIVGTELASLLGTFENEFVGESYSNIMMLGEHKIGRLKGLNLDVVLSPKALIPHEGLLVCKHDDDNSSLVSGDFLPLIQGIPIPTVMAQTEYSVSLKGLASPLGARSVYRITAPGLFTSLVTKL